MALVAKGNRLTRRVVLGARFFYQKKFVVKEKKTFLKDAAFVAKYNVRLILGFDFHENSIYEFRLRNDSKCDNLRISVAPF